MNRFGYAALAVMAATIAPQAALAVPAKIERSDGGGRAEAAEEKVGGLLANFAWDRIGDLDYARGQREALEALRPGVKDPKKLFAIDAVRHMALLTEGRNLESLEVGRQAVALRPDAGPLYATILWAAMYAGDSAAAVDLLERAAQHVRDPETLAELRANLPEDLIFGVLAQLAEAKNQAGRHRAAEALLVLGGDGPGDLAWLDGVRGIAVDGRLEAGRIEAARAVAMTIVDPILLVQLVGTRRYDVLFDASTDRSQLVNAAISRQGTLTAAQLERKPDDFLAIHSRVQHLRSIGKESEALAVAMPHVADVDALAVEGDRAFWTVNEAAYALGALDRHAEAIKLMETLLTLPWDQHPTLINMAINHGGVLTTAGRYPEAAAWAADLESKAKGFASDYGFMWIWSVAACAQSLAGKTDAATPWLAKLAAGSDKNQAAHTRALLCADQLDAAEALVLKRLAGPDAKGLLSALHEYQLGALSSPYQKLLQARWETLRQRPAVKAALDKAGRRLSLPLSKTYWGDH